MTYKAKTPEAGSPPASGLPSHYSPRVAGYARGPFLDPQSITPTDFRWRNARTYIVEHKTGVRYRALRVMVGSHTFGWWAIERLGELLPLPEWDDWELTVGCRAQRDEFDGTCELSEGHEGDHSEGMLSWPNEEDGEREYDD